jgi:L-lactate dehydrogenase complex protein LldG
VSGFHGGSGRDAILGRVRAALGDVPAAEASDDVAVARDYRRAGALGREAVAELFAERCADYRAHITRVPDVAELPAAIAAALRARGARSVAIAAGVPHSWRVDGVAWHEDDGLGHGELDALDGVLTDCAVAIAETGTIVLDGGPAQGRRALTLIPDYHVCVVAAERIVELVPEAIARLHDAAREGRSMTMIAGPSATSDIELNRVEGVHGPRTLDVLVVG